jgi:hypothetical protein
MGKTADCDQGPVHFRLGMGLAGYVVSSYLGFCDAVESPPRMNIIITILFLQPLVLVTLYLHVSGVFTNRRAFQVTFSILLAFFALTIGIGGVQLSYQG